MLDKHTMSAMCNHLKVENGGAHRAIHDVNAMIKIYLETTDFNKYPSELNALIEKHTKLTYTKKRK